MQNELKVEIERVMKATPERLYKMWTDPKMIGGWMGVKVQIDPKIGGAISIDFEEHGITTGEFKKLNPFDLVSFTWNSFVQKTIPSGETLVTVTFKSVGENKTLMKLLHTGFQTELARSEHDGGWTSYFSDWENQLAQ